MSDTPEHPLREPFYLFATLEDELAVTPGLWRSRTPQERMEYLQHMRCVTYGEEATNAPMVRGYGLRKRGEKPDPKKIVYF